jgi:hypothetical protein
MPRYLRVVVALAVVGLLAACGDARPAQPDEVARLSSTAGIAPDLVFVTEIDGFDLATQSVGVSGDDGMTAVYATKDGDSVMVRTGRDAAPSVPACADLADSAPLKCVVERGAAHVILEGSRVSATTLRAAGEAVRVPTQDELERLFAGLPTVERTPPTRGDLPPVGDGAPLDQPGAGG